MNTCSPSSYQQAAFAPPVLLRSLRLLSFRAHQETVLALAPKVNLFVGPNGAGKTNLLEAVSYLCLGRSFLTSSDQHVARRGSSFFEVEGAFAGEGRPDQRIRLAVSLAEGKRAFVNGVPLDRLADLVGRVPHVVLSPADYELTAGGPAERRRFLDVTLSQAYPVYLADLVAYRRALRQRNALLVQVRRGSGLPAGTMAAWDEELVVLGSRLVERRRRFLEGFAVFVVQAYELLEALGEVPALTYAPSVGESGESEVPEAFRSALTRVAKRERDLARTLVGPHLDEIDFTLGGFAVRPFASQGQHRTFGLAVRVATALFLREHLDEPPLLLLDDVFGTLDAERARVVLDLLMSSAVGQSLITAARPEPFRGALPPDDGRHATFSVVDGTVIEAASVSLSL